MSSACRFGGRASVWIFTPTLPRSISTSSFCLRPDGSARASGRPAFVIAGTFDAPVGCLGACAQAPPGPAQDGLGSGGPADMLWLISRCSSDHLRERKVSLRHLDTCVCSCFHAG